MSLFPAASSARPLHRLPSIVPATVEHAVDDSRRQQMKLLPGIAPIKDTQQNLCVFFHNPTVVNVRKPCEQRSDFHSLEIRFCDLMTSVCMLLTMAAILFSQTVAKSCHDVVL